MEGSCSRTYPRMSFDQPVELQIGEETITVRHSSSNNLSGGGLFLHDENLPVGASVRIRIAARRLFEADGQIRSCEHPNSGVGIGFKSLSDGNREALNELIEDLTLRGLPAA
ncbi:MAG: PilZ domain-containing protein [Candidatus Acidiferrales bacterium]